MLEPTLSLASCASITKRAIKLYNIVFKLLVYNNHVEYYITSNKFLKHDYSLDKSNTNKQNSLL
jgi:hypothetical protein